MASTSAPIATARSPSDATRHGSRGGPGQDVPTKPEPGRGEQQVTRVGHVAANQDDPGVDHVGDRGEAPRQVQPGVLEDAQCRDVAIPRSLDDVVDPGVGQLLAHHRQGGARRGVRLEAAAAAAAAQGSLVVEGEVADLARHPVAAAEDLAVEDEPGPDPGGHLDEDDVVVATAQAATVFGEGPEVGIVLDVYDGAERPRRCRPHVDALPGGHDRRGQHPVVADRSGHPHADRADVGPAGAVLLEQTVEQVAGTTQADLVGEARVDAFAGLADDLAGHVPQHDCEVSVTELDAGCQAGAATQPDRRTPTTRAGDPGDDVVALRAPGRCGTPCRRPGRSRGSGRSG